MRKQHLFQCFLQCCGRKFAVESISFLGRADLGLLPVGRRMGDPQADGDADDGGRGLFVSGRDEQISLRECNPIPAFRCLSSYA